MAWTGSLFASIKSERRYTYIEGQGCKSENRYIEDQDCKSDRRYTYIEDQACKSERRYIYILRTKVVNLREDVQYIHI